MALTKDKKQEIIDEVSALLGSSKLTVLAAYPGTSVKSMQRLRREAKVGGTNVKVVKNRLVVKALGSNDKFKDIDVTKFTGQLLYAFNSDDEVAPAQALAAFAKTESSLQFVGAITSDGLFMEPDDVKALASLPSKEQLRAQLIGTIAAPLSGLLNILNGNLAGVLNVLKARAETLS